MARKNVTSHNKEVNEYTESDEIILESISIRMGKDALAYLPSSLTPALITTAIIIIYTRVFEPLEYGRYAIVIATLNILTLLLTSWIRQSTLRYRAEYVDLGQVSNFNKGLRRLLSLMTATIAIIEILVYIVFGRYMGVYQKYYLPSAAYIVTNLWFANLAGILMADIRTKLYSLFVALNSILSLGISLLIVFLIHKDIVGLVWGIFLSEAIMLPFILHASRILSLKANKQAITREKEGLKIELGFVRKMATYGVPLIGWFIGAYLLNISDRYLIQLFRGSFEVGIYSPNYNLVTGVFGLVSTPILSAAHALLMKFQATNKEKSEIQKVITEFSRYYLLVSILLLVLILIFAKDMVSIFLGESYREGYIVIPIILLGYLAWNFGLYGHKGLEIEERTRTMLLYVIICALLNIILNVFFIPWLGYLGAAITSLIGLMLYPVLVYIGTRETFRWNIPWNSFIRILLSSSIVGVFLLLFRVLTGFRQGITYLILGIGIAVILYLPLLYLVGELRDYELQLIRRVLRLDSIRNNMQGL